MRPGEDNKDNPDCGTMCLDWMTNKRDAINRDIVDCDQMCLAKLPAGELQKTSCCNKDNRDPG